MKKILVILSLLFCVSCADTSNNVIFEVMMKDGTTHYVYGYDCAVITSRGTGSSYIVYSVSGDSIFNYDDVLYVKNTNTNAN
jgi:hypothetical protein